MCSIDGFTGESPFTIEQFGSLNKDRGPDGTNYYKSPQISIAHSLLSIQDNPHNIQQPVVNEMTGNVMAYNGEIFDSPYFDTEYMMDLFDERNTDPLVDKVNGMWAVVYYDRAAQTLTMCRDHFGVKGLYYMELGDQLFFSSTPKPLLATLNYKNFEIYPNQYGTRLWENNDRFQYGKRTAIQHIKRLGPGEIRTWDLKAKSWILDGTLNQAHHMDMSPNFAYDLDEFREIAVSSIASVCHAPGINKTIALSGGLDSSLIAGICHANDIKVSATTTSFKKNKNKHVSINDGMFTEAALARKTSKHFGMKFNTAYYNEEHTLRQDALAAMSTPMWDRNRIDPRYFNVHLAKKKKNKIYITGDVADELFTGYNGDNEALMSPESGQVDRLRYQEMIDSNEKWKHMSEIVRPHMLGFDAFNNKRLLRVIAHGDGFATTADHLAGSFGMESRVPFLHQKLVKYAMRIPGVIKLKGNSQDFGGYKYLIREVLGDYLPDHVKERTTKIGWAAPWDARDHEKNKLIGQADLKDFFAWANTVQFPVD
jgi:asparagine synthase (glutamine-hydrolysing)